MKELQSFQFTRKHDNESSQSATSYLHYCSVDETWFNVMRHFATFLDTCGYVGVAEKVEMMLEDYQNQ